MNPNIILGIVIIAFTAIIAVIGAGFGNYFIQIGRSEIAAQSKEELKEHQKVLANQVTDSIGSTEKKILGDTEELKSGQNSMIDSLSKTKGVAEESKKLIEETKEAVGDVGKKIDSKESINVQTGDNSPVLVGDNNNVTFNALPNHISISDVKVTIFNKEAKGIPSVGKRSKNENSDGKFFGSLISFQIETTTPFNYWLIPQVENLVYYRLIHNGGLSQTDNAKIPGTEITSLRFLNAMSGNYVLMIYTSEPVESFKNKVGIYALGKFGYLDIN